MTLVNFFLNVATLVIAGRVANMVKETRKEWQDLLEERRKHEEPK